MAKTFHIYVRYLCKKDFGIVKEINFNKPKLCDGCNGVGFKNIDICIHCNGLGKIKKIFQQPFNFELLCHACKGVGKAYKDICSTCKSRKLFGQESVKLNLKIPAGINEDQNLVIEGHGEPSNSGINGNLVVSIVFKKDELFTKKNLDLHLDLFVPYSTLVLGGKIVIPTIENETIEILIPEGTQADTVLKIKNKGYFNLNNNKYRGDIIVKIKVNVPRGNINYELFQSIKQGGY